MQSVQALGLTLVSKHNGHVTCGCSCTSTCCGEACSSTQHEISLAVYMDDCAAQQGCTLHPPPICELETEGPRHLQGVYHVELKYTSRGPRLIEVNCRMGGGPVRLTNLLVRLHVLLL